MNPLTRILPALTAFGATSAILHGQVVHEPFDYSPTGSALNTYTQSATGLTTDWNDSGTLVDDNSLLYGTLVSSGNKVTMSDDSSWVDTGTTFDGLLDDGDTLWFSVLVKPHAISTNPDFGFALGTDRLNDSNNVPMSNSGNGLGFRLKGGIKATRWVSGAANSASGPGGSGGTTYLIVGEMIFGATDTINIYLPDETLTLGAAVSTHTATIDQTVFDTITFANKAANPRDQFDEIRFGTTSADVLPADATAPSVVSIEDNVFGGPIYEDFSSITYTVTFDQAIDGSSVDTTDFATTGTATNTIDSVTQTDNGLFEVVVTPTSTGTITFEIPSGATILDWSATGVDTTSAIQDDTTITIEAGTSPAMTFLGTTDTDWNDVTNWDGGGATTVVPFGAYSAIIDTGVTTIANDVTIPSYSGGLTFLANSELDVRTGSDNSIGTGPLTFNTGSVLRLRSGNTVTIPGDISMAGDATITNSSNTTDNKVRTLSGVISGPGLLTLEVRRGNIVNITGTNTWSGGFVFNYVDNNFGNGSRVRPDDGSLGSGNVTINDGLQLHVQSGRTDTIDDGASLFLNGRGRDNSPLDNKLFLEGSETVNELWLDNTTGDGSSSVQMPAGDYTATTSPAAAGGGAILDSNGDPLIKGAGTLTVLTGGATDPFVTWAGTGTLGPVTFEGDTNGDGIQDGIAFLLGVTNPDNDANGDLPTVSEDGSGGLVLSFECLPTAGRGTAQLRIEHSSDLGATDAWLATVDQVPDATDAVPDNGVTFVVTPGSPTNDVVATIGSSEAAGGKLFGRLTATE